MLIETTTPVVVYGEAGQLYVHAATGNVHFAAGGSPAGPDRRILVVQLPDGVRSGDCVDVLACGYYHAPAQGGGPVLYEPPADGWGPAPARDLTNFSIDDVHRLIEAGEPLTWRRDLVYVCGDCRRSCYAAAESIAAERNLVDDVGATDAGVVTGFVVCLACSIGRRDPLPGERARGAGSPWAAEDRPKVEKPGA